MARGIRYTREFQEKALRLLGESRANHSSETKALASVSQSLGIAPETLRRWRNKADRTVTAQSVFLVKSVFRVSSLFFRFSA